jgi:hypothetical protein
MEDLTPQQIKIITSRFEHQLKALEVRGLEVYGPIFKLLESDKPVLLKLICYFLRDEDIAAELKLNLNKGILLTGPIGSGKTSLMNLMRYFQPPPQRFILKSCRDVTFDFIRDGYETIHRYSYRSFQDHEPKTYCFDDLGIENNLKYFGNECNVMAEVLLSRYDLFHSRSLVTHITTNLSASEIEAAYGNRVRSRMRELFNLIAFDKTTKDKRK